MPAGAYGTPSPGAPAGMTFAAQGRCSVRATHLPPALRPKPCPPLRRPRAHSPNPPPYPPGTTPPYHRPSGAGGADCVRPPAASGGPRRSSPYFHTAHPPPTPPPAPHPNPLFLRRLSLSQVAPDQIARYCTPTRPPFVQPEPIWRVSETPYLRFPLPSCAAARHPVFSAVFAAFFPNVRDQVNSDTFATPPHHPPPQNGRPQSDLPT